MVITKYFTAHTKRNYAIINMFKNGKTFQDIASLYKLSRQRIQQIVSGRNLKAIDGGYKKKLEIKRHKKRNKYWAKYLKNYKCTRQEYEYIMMGEPVIVDRYNKAYCFTQHKLNSKRRGIDFKLSFPEWWKIWEDSGMFYKRGTCFGEYVMSRYKDSGAYEVGNVCIKLATENIREYYDVTRHIKDCT